MNAKKDISQVLGLIEQAGSLGVTAAEIAGWTGLALSVVEARLRTLRRKGQVAHAKITRATPQGTQGTVYLLRLQDAS